MEDDYVVEDGIPIPPPQRGRRGSDLLTKLRLLEPGQSVFVPRRQVELASQLQNARRHTQRAYTSRKWLEGGVWGTRIWRQS